MSHLRYVITHGYELERDDGEVLEVDITGSWVCETGDGWHVPVTGGYYEGLRVWVGDTEVQLSPAETDRLNQYIEELEMEERLSR